MNERIKQVRQSAGLTQLQFAERLGLSRNFIAMMETGGRDPSDRTISDICREFNINEDWLRTGNGEMSRKLTRSQEIAEFMGDFMNEPDDSPRKRFISVLSKLSVDEWQLLAEIAKKWPRTNDRPRLFFSMRPARVGSARPDRVVPSSQAAACGGCPAGKNFASFYPFPHSSTKIPFIFCSLSRLCFPRRWLTIFVGSFS